MIHIVLTDTERWLLYNTLDGILNRYATLFTDDEVRIRREILFQLSQAKEDGK